MQSCSLECGDKKYMLTPVGQDWLNQIVTYNKPYMFNFNLFMLVNERD